MQILSNEKMVKFTNISKEDFTGRIDIPGAPRLVQKVDSNGTLKYDSRHRPILTKVPTEFLIKAGEVVLMEESKANLFCKQLVDKLLLDAQAPNWTDESLRKPLVLEILNPESSLDEKAEVETEKLGEAEHKAGQPSVNPVLKVKRKYVKKEKAETPKVE